MTIPGPNFLSDDNTFGKNQLIASTKLKYTDIDLSFVLHPIFNDVRPVVDIRAVKNAVKNLIMTDIGERPFQPNLGSGVVGLLFENPTLITIVGLRSEILRVLRVYEPRVDDISVDIIDNTESNGYDVSITFRVISLDKNFTVSFLMERIR